MIKCSICFGAITNSAKATKCGHVFHHECLLRWFERKKNCPDCRRVLSERDCTTLFLTQLDASALSQDTSPRRAAAGADGGLHRREIKALKDRLTEKEAELTASERVLEKRMLDLRAVRKELGVAKSELQVSKSAAKASSNLLEVLEKKERSQERELEQARQKLAAAEYIRMRAGPGKGTFAALVNEENLSAPNLAAAADRAIAHIDEENARTEKRLQRQVQQAGVKFEELQMQNRTLSWHAREMEQYKRAYDQLVARYLAGGKDEYEQPQDVSFGFNPEDNNVNMSSHPSRVRLQPAASKSLLEANALGGGGQGSGLSRSLGALHATKKAPLSFGRRVEGMASVRPRAPRARPAGGGRGQPRERERPPRDEGKASREDTEAGEEASLALEDLLDEAEEPGLDSSDLSDGEAAVQEVPAASLVDELNVDTRAIARSKAARTATKSRRTAGPEGMGGGNGSASDYFGGRKQQRQIGSARLSSSAASSSRVSQVRVRASAAGEPNGKRRRSGPDVHHRKGVAQTVAAANATPGPLSMLEKQSQALRDLEADGDMAVVMVDDDSDDESEFVDMAEAGMTEDRRGGSDAESEERPPAAGDGRHSFLRPSFRPHMRLKKSFVRKTNHLGERITLLQRPHRGRENVPN